MKKKTDKTTKAPQPTAKRRLKLRKEVLRKLDQSDLALVAGGIHCNWTVPPP